MHIFFATDGSESTRFALAHIRDLPWPYPVHVTLLAVLDTPPVCFTSLTPAARRAFNGAMATLRRDARDRAQDVIAEVRHALEPHVQSIAARIHEGSPGPLIAEMAMACRGDLVVVGCQGGAIKSFFLGSASTYVARFGHCSVLLAKRPPSGERRFLLALDGSDHAQAALQWLADLDLSPEDRIQVVTVLESPEPSNGDHVMKRQRADATALPGRFEAGPSAEQDVLAEARQRLGARGLRVTAAARRGHAASEVLAAAREFGAQWLVLGANGQQSSSDSALGAVASKVIAHARCSTVVVRPPGGTTRTSSTTPPT
jgi:nucleotide-binding universal stress UspA family protein